MKLSVSIKKTFKYFILLLILIVGLTGCVQVDTSETEASQETPKLKAYFPMHQGMEYSYAGEGNEFAPFKRKIMYVKDNYLQLTDNNGGTIIVKVYKLSDQEVSEVFYKGEFYEDDNLIPDVRENEEKDEVILKAPIEVGNSWNSNDQEREIVAVDQEIKIPAGTFYQVVKVKTTYQDSNNDGYEYFAPNIGLIKTEYIGEGFEIKSELESFNLNIE